MDDLTDEVDDVGTTSELYNSVKALQQAFCDRWQAAWTPCNIIVPDESMIFWTGTGEVHINYIPRKPTPYGIEMKTLACASARIVLQMEMVEGRELDATKKYRDQVGASTATTLRLCEPWAGSGRIVVADAWFGSCNTAEWLMDVLGLYCILAVKTGHRGFPKQELIRQIRPTRYSSAFKKVTV